MCYSREKIKQTLEKVQSVKKIVFKEFLNKKIFNILMIAFKILIRQITNLLLLKSPVQMSIFFIRINQQQLKIIVSFSKFKAKIKINLVNKKQILIIMILYLNQKMSTIRNIKCKKIVKLIWKVKEVIDPIRNCFKAVIISLLKVKIYLYKVEVTKNHLIN